MIITKKRACILEGEIQDELESVQQEIMHMMYI